MADYEVVSPKHVHTQNAINRSKTKFRAKKQKPYKISGRVAPLIRNSVWRHHEFRGARRHHFRADLFLGG